MTRDQDSRSSVSQGLEWGTRVTTIGLEFALPAVLGHGLDRWLGSAPWLTVGGAFLGLAIGMLHIFRLPGELARAEERRRPPRSGGDAGRADA
ncbi:AtpZ/AtpI family protein [Paludisphaera mucosa]|uniref:AtpZ/AtpI family protein n=1 Tax=Paludisphaera mucosa TaxID=3030827 RepID=A0ABT6FGR6_9BACT|nr:AtpZ/AtpI family protein [Paludisphaera mucosa]